MNTIFFNNNFIAKENSKNKIDGILLLNNLKNESIKVCFFDPQYRGVLDKLSYGNEGKGRGKERSSLPQMSTEIISNFLKKIEKALMPSGYLFLWVDKFHLVEGIKSWLSDNSELVPVDMIVWNKCKMGMGYRSRRISEYLIVLRKKPIKAKSTWAIHNIPDVWDEKVTKTHPHTKPYNLQKKLILATTEENDYICDPAAGGYGILEICKETKRNFIGGDIFWE